MSPVEECAWEEKKPRRGAEGDHQVQAQEERRRAEGCTGDSEADTDRFRARRADAGTREETSVPETAHRIAKT